MTGASTEPKVLLGVDGGGTKTEAVVAALDGTLLGRGFAASSNHQKVGMDGACAAISAAVHAAFADAGLAGATPAAVCLGISGIDRNEDVELFRPWAARCFPGAPIALINDAELALAAGTPDGYGVGVICGTGSICTGRSRQGERARADGWGWLLGDEGSGFSIGQAAMRAVMRAYDGRGPATLLSGAVLAHWQLSSPEDLIERVYIRQAGPADIAGLAAVVNEAAQEGDAVARAILEQAAEDLAVTIVTVARRLGYADAVPCGLAGGVVVKSACMADFIQAAARRRGLLLDPVALVAEPALGAVRLAQRLGAQAEGAAPAG